MGVAGFFLNLLSPDGEKRITNRRVVPMAQTSRRFAAICAALMAPVLLAPTVACATVNYSAPYDFVTTSAEGAFFSGQGCTPGTCSRLPNPGTTGQVNSSDAAVGQEDIISGLADGEVVSWQAIKPDGSIVFMYSLTCNQGLNCFVGSDTQRYCGGNYIDFATAITTNMCRCFKAIGSWSIGVYDNGTLLYSNPFTVSHNSSNSSVLGISSPTDGQLFDLNQQTYTATGNVPFNAATNTGSLITWTSTLSYQTSEGKGNYTANHPPGFSTNSGQGHDYTYVSEGGSVSVTAQTTASDGSAMQDCVTFYVEGTQSFDPTSRLLTLYSSGTTPQLMTGIAQHESAYHQFASQNLLGATALWPHESYDGGSHIGLMMVPVSEALAWDWQQNTNDGVNSTDHGFLAAKLPLATTWVTRMIKGSSTYNVPAHKNLGQLTGLQLENMALVLYGPASASWTGQYYIPVCTGTISKSGNTWICNGASWYRAVNDPNTDDPGADPNVQAQYIFAPGNNGTFGNREGLQYVSNHSGDPWYDSTLQDGVRHQMH